MNDKQNIEKIVGLFINAKYTKLAFMQNQVQRPLTKKEIQETVTKLLDEFKELYELFSDEGDDEGDESEPEIDVNS